MRVAASILFVPAANPRALAKAGSLGCDAVIIDLEDSAGAEEKDRARQAATEALAGDGLTRKIRALRVNGPDTPWFADDIAAAADAPDCAIVLPKVSGPDELRQAREAMAAAGEVSPVWAMIETPMGLMNLKEIGACADAVGLAALIAGPNDLAHALRLPPGAAREGLVPHLAAMVAAARAYGLNVYDGVYNDISDADGFAEEARQARRLGFDGKTLIHPGQIGPANAAFAPDAGELDWARAVVRGFAAPENAGKGAINVGGRMVERMHLDRAEALLARAAAARA